MQEEGMGGHCTLSTVQTLNMLYDGTPVCVSELVEKKGTMVSYPITIKGNLLHVQSRCGLPYAEAPKQMVTLFFLVVEIPLVAAVNTLPIICICLHEMGEDKACDAHGWIKCWVTPIHLEGINKCTYGYFSEAS